MIESNSNAVIITIAINTPLSINGGLKKNDKMNLVKPESIKLKVRNILNPSSIFDESM